MPVRIDTLEKLSSGHVIPTKIAAVKNVTGLSYVWAMSVKREPA